MKTELTKWLEYTDRHLGEKPEWFSISYIRERMYYTLVYDYRTGAFIEEWHPVESDIEL